MKQFRLLLMTAFAAILLFIVSCNDEAETTTDEATGDTTVATTAVKPDTSRVLRESTNVKPPEPATLQPPSKKFFDGRKTFCDSLGTSYYSVIIIKGNILLNKYSGKPNDKMSAPLTKSKAILSGENILSPETHVVNFRYENNTLYEKADEFGRWIRYVECK